MEEIENLRLQLHSTPDIIDVVDLGAASQRFNSSSRRVRDIARSSLSPKKQSILYRNLIRYAHAKEVLELGTSLGINTLYMASANPQANIKTLEGSPAIAAIAQKNFDFLKFRNISLVAGNIDETLKAVVDKIDNLDIAFIDANHRYGPTLSYFETLLRKTHDGSIVILDDIHYSPEMERAWKAIKVHPKVFATADLYRCGLVFFDPSLAKQHFVLQG
ncbi:MAG: class I SAM-dependent methyltransferase [Chryseolinea sp.]